MDHIATESPTHPLDALTAAEILRFGEIVRQAGIAGETSRFGYLMLREPEKSVVLQFRAGDAFSREVSATIYDTTTRKLEYVSANVTTGIIVERREIDQVKEGTAPFLTEELFDTIGLVMEHPEFHQALLARGITEFDRVRCIPLAGGNFGYADEVGIRVSRVVTYLAPNAEFGSMASFWGQPIEGLRIDVDLSNKRVLRVIDTGHYPIPTESGEIHTPESLGEPRTGLKPIAIAQPEGVSFTLNGNEMSWQNWNFRIGYNAREGLTLHQISFEDKGKKRPIIYRASVAEMVVNYGDVSPTRGWINYFDAGEYQFGRFANSLKLGCDCLGEIVYKDVVFADDFGQPVVVKNGICIHEEDYGVLWKHTDPFDTSRSEVRRQRRLVVSCFLTAGNYDYGFYWHFYLDGKIELEVKANGLVVTAGSREGEAHPTPLIAPDLGAPVHQHLFCLRLDMSVDGTRNSVDEVEPVPIAMDRTQAIWGGAFEGKVTRLKTEGEAQRVTATEKGRVWKISSSETRNRIGRAPAYVLHTAGNPLLLSDPDSLIARRAKFATKSLWVTKYRRDENWPAGYLVNHSPGDTGLPQYASRNESIDNEDIVVWHTFGLTHIPRPEDWPVMPCDYAKVALLPYGFFERNPALDVPPTQSAHCAPASGCGHEKK
ncbi:primary-amine oxidase [Burkholderia multivorans]|nr:primary-amine oxidase [Burkholderia multivorans]